MSSLYNYLLPFDNLKEVEGAKSNPQLLPIIQKYVKDANDDSTTSWCSIILMEVFKDHFDITNATPSARSWLKVGKQTIEPIVGNSIVVFHNGDIKSWQGHVGIYMGKDPNNSNRILVYGGNQSNKITKSSYPESRVLGYVNLKPL